MEKRIFERVIDHCLSCPNAHCFRISHKRHSATMCGVLKKYIATNTIEPPTQEQEKEIYNIPYKFLPDCPLKKSV
jgi:hypothetical protein